MSDAGGSILAITEKKTQRASGGGCVGIFFQLFDWNRRLAKKKLFSNKLLPLGSKKFGTDDKLPKLRLMSDEKNDSFSNGKKKGTRNVDSGQKQAMRTPTLVARLMGLDSLPAVQRNKSKKSYEIGVDRGERFAGDSCPFDSQQIKLEKEGSKHESRPQKLQKTGVSEKRAVSRFGAEGLQFKSVLSRPSKHNHPKFVSPVKSPKSLSKKNASRLIGAATRILEPGLQARNRAICSLPYPSQRRQNQTDGHLVEAETAVSKDQVGSSTYYENEVKLSRGRGQTSCENYGKFVDVLESRSYLEEQRSVSDYMDCSSFRFESRQRSSLSSLEPQIESTCTRNPEKSTDFDFQSHRNVNPRAEHNLYRTALQKGGQTRWQLTSQQYTRKEASPSSFCYDQKIGVRDQGIPGMDRIPPRSIYSVDLSEEPLNQRPISRNSRMHGKLDNCRYVSERRSTDRRYDPLSSARKRRSVNVAKQGDVSGFASSPINKLKNSNCNALGQTIVREDGQSTNLPCIGSNLARHGEIIKISDTDNGDVSFTFSSSKKNKDRILTKRDDRGYQSECTCSHSSQRSSALDTINRKSPCFQKLSPSTEDTLSVFLEQKLKELNSQENEMPLGCSPLKRTSAVILQELISALSVERSFDANDVVFRPTEMGDSSCCEHASGLHSSFQAKQKPTEAQVRYPNDSNNNNMSPLSVLEASIANESCLSSSLDDGSVHKLQIDFIDLSYNEAQQLEPGVDRLHGATSVSKGSPCIELVADFVNGISDVVCSMDLVDSRLKGSKLAHAEEVILNAELVFGNTFRHNSDEIKGFSLCWFIVNELETLGSVLWTNFGCFSESQDTEGNLLKGFLFDCVIEYLDSRYVPRMEGGIKSWRDLPLSMNNETLIAEVVEEIRSWTSCANFVLDEITEREMSKWTNFDVETFETSVAIDEAILHSLVDEIVMDLWQRKPNLYV